MENYSEKASNKLALLNSLLIQIEELIFSVPFPEESLKRYEKLRNEIYSQIGITSSSKVWKLQRETYNKALTTKKEAFTQINMYVETEKMYKLQIAEVEQKIESIKWETIQKIHNGHKIIEDYQYLSSIMLGFIENYTILIGNILGIDTIKKTPEKHFEEGNSFNIDYENDYESILEDLKNFQTLEYNQMSDLSNEFKLKEHDFLNYFDLLQNELKQKDKKCIEIEVISQEENEKNQLEIQNLKNKIKNYEELLKQKNEDFKKESQKEIKKIMKENKIVEENLIKKHQNDIQSCFLEKEKANKKLMQALEDHEKSQENYISIINNLRVEIQEISSEKLLLINKVERNSSDVNELKLQIEDLQSIIKREKIQKESFEVENYKLKNLLNQTHEQLDYETESMKNTYKKMIEKLSSEGQDEVKKFENMVYHLEDELEEKNKNIAKLYLNIDQLSLEKSDYFEMLSEKGKELEESFIKYHKLEDALNHLEHELDKYKQQFQNIQELSKKYYCLIKSKSNISIDDYFTELISCIPQLLSDKEWLIRKISDLSSTNENLKQSRIINYPEVSRQKNTKEFYNSSINSFKVLKVFEKSRSELINKFNQ